MATLAPVGRITVNEVREEITGLKEAWGYESDLQQTSQPLEHLLGKEKTDDLDLFDQKTLEAVVDVCRNSTRLEEPC